MSCTKVISVIVLVIAVSACESRTTVERTFSAPSGPYRITVVGETNRPHVPFVENVVDVVISNAAASAPLRFEIFRSDFLEDSFTDRYEWPSWADDRTVLFRAQVRYPTSLDSVTFVNQSGRTIRHLKIQAADMILAWDLPPGYRRSISISRQHRADMDSVSVEGRFADGTVILSKTSNFPRSMQDAERRAYSITVLDTGSSITSQSAGETAR